MSNDNEEDRVWPECVEEADLLRSELAATRAASLAVVKTLQDQINVLTAKLAKADKDSERDSEYIAHLNEMLPEPVYGWQGGSNNL